MSSRVPSTLGGVSNTIGPLETSMKPRKYTVSALAVRNSDLASINSEKMRISLSLTPSVEKASACGDQADALHRVDERVVGVREVDVVVSLFQCGLARRAVLEVERAEPRLDFVRRGDRRRDCRCRLGGGQVGQHQCGTDQGRKESDWLHQSPLLIETHRERSLTRRPPVRIDVTPISGSNHCGNTRRARWKHVSRTVTVVSRCFARSRYIEGCRLR